MSANIPTPFNLGRTSSGSDPLFDSNDTSDGGALKLSGGDTVGNLKTAGGLPSDQLGVNFTITSGKAGTRYYFNSNPTALDFTASGERRLLLLGVQANAGNRRQINTKANEGISIKMYSGSNTTSEIREWVLGGQDTGIGLRTGIFLLAVDPEANGTISDVGNFDPSNVLRYGQFITHGSMVGGNSAWWFWCAAVLISSEKDSTDIPRIYGTSSSWQDLVDAVQGTTDFRGQNHIYVEKVGDQINLLCPCSIGNASQTSPSQTTFNDNGLTVVSPSSNQTSDPRFQLSDYSMRVYIDLRNDSTDSATFSGTYNWGTLVDFDFSQNNAAQVTFNKPTFKGMGDFVCGSSVTGSATFDLGSNKKLIIRGANLNGSTVLGDINIEGSTVNTFTNFTVTGSMNFDTAGTYENNGGTINEVTNSSGGNIVINNTNGGVVTTNTGPNITITEPDQPISITNIVAGSRMRIYNVTTGTETVNTVVAGTSYTSSYQEGTGYNDGDTVRVYLTKLGKSEWVGDVIDTSNGFNVLASQVDDDVYTALGVDGSTVTKFQADYPNNEVDLIIGSDWTMAELYAWWSYNLTTEDGIRNFFGGITAIDQANFRINTSVVNLYLDNTTNASYRQTDNRRFFRDTGDGYPVRIPTTSGYGLDVVWRNTILIAQTEAGGTSDLNFYDVKRAVKQVITNPKYVKGQK
jgi:hypothetical protein